MPLNLDSCITGIFVPGNIGASSGQTPVAPSIPSLSVGNYGVGTAHGVGSAVGDTSVRGVGTAAGTGAASATGTVGPDAAPHRYWRINITAVNTVGHTVAAILEVQFHTGSAGYGTDSLVSGTASADSVNGGVEVASRAADGTLFDSNGCWGSTNTAFPHWWKYDYGSGNDVIVRGVSILARGSGADGVGGTVNMMAPKDFNIQFSDDNSSWTTKWSETGQTYSAYQFKHFRADATSYSGSPHGSHQHWRIKLNEDNGGNISSAEEIEMRATPGGSDQCSGGSPISDGEFSGQVDDNAFDNNTGTYYASTVSSSGAAYIGYSFAAPVEVAEVAWRCRTSDTAQTPKTLIIQYADSASGPWTIAWGVIGQTGWSGGQTRTFTDPNYV